MSGKPPPRPLGQVFVGYLSNDQWLRFMSTGDIVSSAAWYSPTMSPDPRPHWVVSTTPAEGLHPTRGGGSRWARGR